MFYLNPNSIANDPVTDYNTSRSGDTDNQTGPKRPRVADTAGMPEVTDELVAPLHATTSGSVRPVTNTGVVIYARPDEEKKRKLKQKSDLGIENPTKPIGMGTANDEPYNNGYGVTQRQDNESKAILYPDFTRLKLKSKKSKIAATEWLERSKLNLIREDEKPLGLSDEPDESDELEKPESPVKEGKVIGSFNTKRVNDAHSKMLRVRDPNAPPLGLGEMPGRKKVVVPKEVVPKFIKFPKMKS